MNQDPNPMDDDEPTELECSYIVKVHQTDGEPGRALARNTIASVLRDLVGAHPHFEEYGTITITVEEI